MPETSSRRPGITVRAREVTTERMIASRIFSGYMGPTFITKWCMRVAAAHEGDVEFQIGKEAGWSK